jgi:hypothetical protein
LPSEGPMIFRTAITLGAAVVLFGSAWQPATALSIEILPPSQSVAVGQQASVDVVVDPTGNLIGAFDVLLAWDPALLEFTDSVFDPDGALGFALGGELLLGDGAVNVAGVSLEFDLTPFQDGISPVSLVSVTFTALAEGTSALTLSPGITPLSEFLGDELGDPLTVDEVNNGQIVVEPAVVPEPPTLLLIGLGLAVAGAFRRGCR